MMRLSTIMAAALLAAGAVPTKAAQFVILESNVANFGAGSTISGSKVVDLGEDAKMVIIDPGGFTRTVAGPYQGPIGKAGADTPSAIERLSTQRDGSNHVVGAIRAPNFDEGQDEKDE